MGDGCFQSVFSRRNDRKNSLLHAISNTVESNRLFKIYIFRIYRNLYLFGVYMKTKIELGDIVSVLNAGHTYSTHMLAAKELGADYDPEEYRLLYRREMGTIPPAFRTMTYKWRWQGIPTRNDICEVISEWNGHHLIERQSDGRQFIVDPQGLKFVRKNIHLEEDLFEL
jgi:hypothetical protein